MNWALTLNIYSIAQVLHELLCIYGDSFMTCSMYSCSELITLSHEHSCSIWHSPHYNKIMCSQTVFPIWWKDLGRHRTAFVHTQHSAFHLDPQCVLVNWYLYQRNTAFLCNELSFFPLPNFTWYKRICEIVLCHFEMSCLLLVRNYHSPKLLKNKPHLGGEWRYMNYHFKVSEYDFSVMLFPF